MTIDPEIFANAMRDAIREGIKKQITDGYNSPLRELCEKAVEANAPKFRKLLEDSIATCLNDQEFTGSIATAVRSSLAKQLIQKFGGELEKQVNVLKSDPTTRARITLAIEEIVKSKT